ncbi:glyoxalase superfamily protein [Paracoccus aminophilus]|uniref:Bleomycin resistance protein n=1 Tax=Paracoccus aminophilus JCM 7686 TaxID=1367847 RepID=S5YXL2_PARAH|nr:glyoxalase superfamily protein [Paracoccus aminophilus]AGT09946.1 hypothetical protein JCM7686_2890 [Paracoccus aminophilus JCM 7686]
MKFTQTAPVLRIFDIAKAREFYCGFLGMGWDWEHRFHEGAPLYAQVSRAGLVLHLSEHHGDATPGSTVFVRMEGIAAFHAEVIARNYPYLRPGIEEMPWGRMMTVTDPFMNRIRFNEDIGEA